MAVPRKNPLHKIRQTKIIYPILLGVGVVLFLFFRNFDSAIFKEIRFQRFAVFWLFVAILLMGVRDAGYMVRLRVLSDEKLNWRQAFRVIMLWEFTSAITPSAIGGTSVAIIYVNKEGLSIGKSSAVVMATSFLDELYFILAFPLLLLFLSSEKLFHLDGYNQGHLVFSNDFFLFAIIGYSVKLLYLIVLSYGLFLNPRGIKWLLLWVFKLPILRRWRQGANEAGSEIVASSRELRKKPFGFWLKAFTATAFSWTARYWVVNALFLVFFIIPDHFLLFARQLVAWIMMLIFPTPGGSGGSEWVFSHFFRDFIPVAAQYKEAFSLVLAFLWRLISYYPYLLIGAIIFPRWIRMKFGSGSNNNN